ncbi:hypothetical protein LCGC14_3074730 [marine sediment metagenome]|uniref:Uncharacterized protein n=1 Tax=marine sediment metagenome TaxID=412755 RepID=A0A0F8YMQ2_9ZZZZ
MLGLSLPEAIEKLVEDSIPGEVTCEDCGAKLDTYINWYEVKKSIYTLCRDFTERLEEKAKEIKISIQNINIEKFLKKFQKEENKNESK